MTLNKKTRLVLTGAGILLIVGLIAITVVRAPNPTAKVPTEETEIPAPLSEADGPEEAPTSDSPDAADASKTEATGPDAVSSQNVEESTGSRSKRKYIWDPKRTDHGNRIGQKLFEIYGATAPPEETPREVIEILVEGVDYATAAKNLLFPPHDRSWPWSKREPAYALEYAELALAEDPTSRDGLYVMFTLPHTKEERQSYGLQLLEHHPNDERILFESGFALMEDFPVEVVAALEPYAAKNDVGWMIHTPLSHAYARLGMLNKARDHRQLAYEGGAIRYWDGVDLAEVWPSTIWEDWDKAAAEAAAKRQIAEGSAFSPPSDLQPSAPDRAPPPPQGQDRPPLEHARMAADAYARAAKAYHDAFRRAYEHPGSFPPLPAADSPVSSEAYLNAMVGIARAFAVSGDAEQAQAVYTQARQLFTKKEAEEAFRRFDEEDKRQRERKR